MHRQVSALGPGIRYIEERVAGELMLDIKVPLLDVRRRIAA
jgi:hypothetical protein